MPPGDTNISWYEKLKIWPWNRAKFLQHLPYQVREALWIRASNSVNVGWLGCLGLVLLFPACAMIHELLNLLLIQPLRGHSQYDLIQLLVFILAFVLPYCLILIFRSRFTAQKVKLILIEQHKDGQLPICFKCGYPTKGLPAETAHCPECGTSLHDPPVELL